MDNNIIKEDYKKKYDILNEIGKGTYEKVFKARDKETNEIKALKIIDLDDFNEEEIEIELSFIINELNAMMVCSNDNKNNYSVNFMNIYGMKRNL